MPGNLGPGLEDRREAVLGRLERGDPQPLDDLFEGVPDPVTASLAAAPPGPAGPVTASVAAAPPGPAGPGWPVALWRAMRALLEGRTHEAQRRNDEAVTAASLAGSPGAVRACAVQTLHLRVAQGRLAEMEAPARALAAEPGAGPVGHATLAWLLVLLGRDRESRAALVARGEPTSRPQGETDERDRLAALVLRADVVARLDDRVEAAALVEDLLPHRFRIAVDGQGAVCLGSVSRPLGLLAHVLSRWDDADAHFENALVANRGIGAPLLAAHTCREWSALLRARGGGADWDRAIDLLVDAEALYRRLGMDAPAAATQGVLARAAAGDETTVAVNSFRQEEDQWVLSFAGRLTKVGHGTGMAHLGRLLAHPGQAFHVADLAGASARGAAAAVGLGRADEGQPWGAFGADRPVARPKALDGATRDEYLARLDELDRRLGDTDHPLDPMDAALARAEADRLRAELRAADEPGAPPGDPLADPLEQARLMVATALRLSIDRIQEVHPPLGRHLRLFVRTGMFCSYEPPMPVTWRT